MFTARTRCHTSPVRAALALLALLVLAGCLPEAAPDPAAPAPMLGEQRRIECERRGGSWGQGSTPSSFACYLDTGEGLKACTKSTDCKGQCLARSRTCAPVTPLLGCNDVLNSQGLATSLCIN